MEILLCSIPEAAKALGVGRSKVYELIGEGRLETRNIGRRRLVRTASIHALVVGELGLHPVDLDPLDLDALDRDGPQRCGRRSRVPLWPKPE